MIFRRRTRSVRRSLSLAVAVGLIAGVLAGIVLARSGPAGAGTTGASYGVYASGSVEVNLPVASLGGSPAVVANGRSESGPTVINSTATLGVAEGISGDIPQITVFSVPGNSFVGSVSTNNPPAGFAADPADPNIVYTVESYSSGTVSSLRINPLASGLSTIAAVGPAGVSTSCVAIAVTPDGGTAVVACDYFNGNTTVGFLSRVSTATGSVATWNLPGGYDAVDLAVSPDGTAVDVAATGPRGLGEVFGLPINFGPKATPTWARALTKPFRIPTALTVSRDGATVYVAGNNGPSSGSVVQAFAAGTGLPGSFATIQLVTDGNGFGGLTGIALTPDGSTLLAFGGNILPSGAADDRIYPVATSGMTIGAASRSLGNSSTYGPEDIAVTPDQAPVADLAPTSGTAGVPLTLDASSSNIAYGSISRYVWNFGDGSPAVTTAGPTVTHTYGAPGNYSASVVETDSAGTSVPPAPTAATFAVNGPGTTPYLRASNSAAIAAPIAIGSPNGPPPPPPTTVAPHHGTTTTTVKHGHPKSYHPAIKLVPDIGTPGTIVTVTGHGFPPHKKVTVVWSTKTASFSENTDANGNLPAHTLFILTPDVLGSRKAVASIQGSSTTAAAAFLVVPGSAQPGGSSEDVVFRSEGP